MLIDWFTVGAQAVNFLILVWLMKRFLYRPVLAAIDAREQRVAAVLADADAKQAAARVERDQLQEKNSAFEQQRTAAWSKAVDEANAERVRLLGDAVQAADAIAARRQLELQVEAAGLARAIGQRTQHEVFAIVRQTLAELADASLEDQVCAVFERRLRTLDGASKGRFAAAIDAATGPARLRSAFDVSEASRAKLRQALNETFSADIPLQFETAPELVAGIELTVGGQRLEWSIAVQVATLSKSVGDWLTKPLAAAGPARALADPKTEAADPGKPSESQPINSNPETVAA